MVAKLAVGLGLGRAQLPGCRDVFLVGSICIPPPSNNTRPSKKTSNLGTIYWEFQHLLPHLAKRISLKTNAHRELRDARHPTIDLKPLHIIPQLGESANKIRNQPDSRPVRSNLFPALFCTALKHR